jgi:hypothetical protein
MKFSEFYTHARYDFAIVNVITEKDGDLVSNVLNLPTDSNIKQYKDFQIFHMQPIIENEKHGFRMFIAKSSKDYGSFCLKNQVWSTTNMEYKAIVNQFNYYYNLWKNDQITFKNPDDEDKFLNAVCISRLHAYGEKIPEDVRMHGDVILERELKKLNDFKINYDI